MGALLEIFRFMPSDFRACARLLVFLSVAVAAAPVSAQNAFSPGGPDYLIAGPLGGDQTAPHAAVGANGGWLVWQDNAADGDGLGVSAVRLGSNLTAIASVFRVNQVGAGDQEKPRVALLQNGGAVVVWQGGQFGFQKIVARFLNPNGSFATGDIAVNTYTNFHQVAPAVATLADGSVIVVWSSFTQDGSLLGVYGQRFSAAGVKLGGEFRINQFVGNNQRTPAVAALANGNFVVAWVSELQRGSSSVDIYARIFDSAGGTVTGEFAVNPSSTNLCANPSVAASAQGGFAAAWSQKDAVHRTVAGEFPAGAPRPNSWDVFVRLYGNSGAAATGPVQLNTLNYGDQFAPQVSAFGKNYLAAWVSLGHDGAREGIYGQFLNSSGALEGVEFRANTDTASRQIHPAIASDGVNRFLVLWTSFRAGSSFDLVARSYEIIRTEARPEAGGVRLTWNTQPGCVYQVQVSSNLGSWINQGPERPAAGTSDSLLLNLGNNASYYRVIRLR